MEKRLGRNKSGSRDTSSEAVVQSGKRRWSFGLGTAGKRGVDGLGCIWRWSGQGLGELEVGS